MTLSLNCNQLFEQIDCILKELDVVQSFKHIHPHIKQSYILHDIYIDGYSLLTALYSIPNNDKIYHYLTILIEKGMDINRQDYNNKTIFDIFIQDYNNDKKLKSMIDNKFTFGINNNISSLYCLPDIKIEILNLLTINLDNRHIDEISHRILDVIYARYNNEKNDNNKNKLKILIEYILDRSSIIQHGNTIYTCYIAFIFDVIRNNDIIFIEKIFINDKDIIKNNKLNAQICLKYFNIKTLLPHILNNMNDILFDFIKNIIETCAEVHMMRELNLYILEHIKNFGKYGEQLFMLIINYYTEPNKCEYIKHIEFELLIRITTNFDIDKYIDNLMYINNKCKELTDVTLPSLDCVMYLFEKHKDKYWNYIKIFYKNFDLNTYICENYKYILSANYFSLLLPMISNYIFRDKILNEISHSNNYYSDTTKGTILSICNENIDKFIYNTIISGSISKTINLKDILHIYKPHKFIYGFCKQLPNNNIFNNIYYLFSQINIILLIFKTNILNKEMQYVIKHCIMPLVWCK